MGESGTIDRKRILIRPRPFMYGVLGHPGSNGVATRYWGSLRLLACPRQESWVGTSSSGPRMNLGPIPAGQPSSRHRKEMPLARDPL